MISEVLFVMVFCFSVKINRRVGDLSYQCRKWIVRGVEKAAEEIAKKRSSDIDPCIVQSTEPLGEDHAQEQFFEAIPSFFSSDVQYRTTKHDKFDSARNRFFRGNRMPGSFQNQLR